MSMLGSVSEHVQGQKGSSLPLLFCKPAHVKMVPWLREPRKDKEKDYFGFAQFTIPSSPQPWIIQPGKHVQTGLPQAWPAKSCKCVLNCLEGETREAKELLDQTHRQFLELFLPGMYQIQCLQSMCEPEISQCFQLCSQLQPGFPLRSSY